MRGRGISIRAATWLGGIGIGGLVLLGGFLVWSFVTDSRKERTWAEHSYEIVDTLQKAQLSLFQAGAERSAILLYDEGRSRDGLKQAIADLQADLAYLQDLTGADAAQRDRAETLQVDVEALVAEWWRPLDQPELLHRDVRLALVAVATEMRDALVRQFVVMVEAERKILAERRTLSDQRASDLVRLLIGTLVVAAIFAVIALWGVSRHLRSNAGRIEALVHSKARVDAAYSELALSQQRLQSVLDYANDAILLVGPDGAVKLANVASAALFGRPLAQIVGAPITRLLPDFGGDGRNVEAVRADDSRFPADLSVSEVASGGDASDRVCILRDATERHRLDLLKNEFVSTVSHELRTPLTSIRGSLGLLLGGLAGELSPKAREFIEIAHSNSARLVLLVNDILDIEKIESGRMEFRRDWVPARQLLERALADNKAYADQYGVAIRLVGEMAPDSEIYADPERIQQVMANLLSNAAKFSNAGGVVEIEVREEAAQIHIAVRDHGAGIPEEFSGRIFQRFAQADASDRRSKGGTGLGLSITKAIVDHHGGSIGFETPTGGGTRFHFTLPRRQRPAPMSALDEGGGRRVLIVEDDADVAKLLSLMLGQAGWRSRIAGSAAEARRLLAEERFDAVTLDVGLPDENGLSLFRGLRASAATRDLPIVIVSASADLARQDLNGDAIGVVDWIDKPIDQDRLQQALRNALRHAARPVRILHVEDDPDILKVVAAVMGGEAEVVAARTLAEARRRLAGDGFSLVIVDIGLPDGSGLDLIDGIRRLERPPPVLIFSAQDYDPATACRVAASLVKSRTDNRSLHSIVRSLIEGGNAGNDR